MTPQTWTFEPYRRIGQLIIYYFLAAPWPFEPTSKDYKKWLETLPQEERVFYHELGFEACQAVNAFRQYWLEERDYYLKDYLRMHLLPVEYTMYEQMKRDSGLCSLFEESQLKPLEDQFASINLIV